jgi:hypothetical protein
MKKLTRVVFLICVVGSFASFFFGISLYYRDFPNKPQPELGRTHPINNHGFLMYLTHREESEQTLSFVLAGVLAVFLVIVDRLVDPFDRCKREVPPKQMAPWNHRWGP